MNGLDPTPLVVYTLAMTLNPGPSSLLIAATGARFGLARCTPHLAGSLLGYELELVAAALGSWRRVVVISPSECHPVRSMTLCFAPPFP